MVAHFEVCLDDVDGIAAIRGGGAESVELVANLSAGGTTPSTGTIAAAREAAAGGIDVHVMVRPRAGDFVYSRREFEAMLHDARTLATVDPAGTATGVVSGILLPDGSIDVARTRALVEAAGGLPVTMHKAFDLTPEPRRALDDLRECGVKRVLTSGGRRSLRDGVSGITSLVQHAGDEITIVAAGALDGGDDLPSALRDSGVRDMHFTALTRRPSASSACNPEIPFDEGSRLVTSAQLVAAIIDRFRG